MQCKELESVLEMQGLGQLSQDARLHLATCGACQGLVADLNSIVSVAKSLPAEVAPPDRIWISLRAQLEAEGLIKEPVEVAEQSPWWQSLTAWMRPRTFATVAAAALVLSAAVYLTRLPHKPTPGVAKNQPAAESPRPAQPQVTTSAPPVSTSPVTVQAKRPTPSKEKELAPSPSVSASFTLNQAELDVTSMQLAGNSQVDAAIRQNLRTLNAFIAECEKHLKQNPQDELAREYLNTAYQQKADLLAAMMESGRGDN
jgi:ribosomal protein S15P/S13E